MMRRSLRKIFNMEGYIVIPKLLSGAELDSVRDASIGALNKYYEEVEKTAPGKDVIRINTLHLPNKGLNF